MGELETESLSLSGAAVLGLSRPTVTRHLFRRADLNEHAAWQVAVILARLLTTLSEAARATDTALPPIVRNKQSSGAENAPTNGSDRR